MQTVRFGRTDVELPRVGLGTWAHGGPNVVHGRPVGWFGAEDDAVLETLRQAHAEGIVHWDTADVYGEGRSEQMIGQIWSEVPRDEIFLASKVGWDPGNYSHYFHPAQIRHQLERSLRNLRTDHLDLYYLHHCDFGPEAEYLEDALDLMRSFRREGKIRWIGLSDWKSENIVRYADLVDPDVVQCYRNVVDDDYESSGLREWVEENDAGVAFFSPLKHGLLLGQFEGPVTFGEGDHRSTLPEFRDFGLISRLRACRREIERRFSDREQPVLHALVGALLADSEHSIALVGQRRPVHARAAAQVGDPLSETDARWVQELYQANGRRQRAAWKESFHSGV